MAVTIPMMYICPESRATAKPAIITRVHIVRVINVCFFFSYSDTGGSSTCDGPFDDMSAMATNWDWSVDVFNSAGTYFSWNCRTRGIPPRCLLRPFHSRRSLSGFLDPTCLHLFPRCSLSFPPSHSLLDD